MQTAVPRHVLPVLVTAQFAGTSLWFAVNAVMPDLQRELGWPAAAVGTLTSGLQFGFIVGTLVFALLAIADRFSARRVFLLCSLAGAACTVGAWAMVRDYSALLVWRFATGFFLAGIYPVGMKIAAQWYTRGLGGALGLLIGALVLGSASAHALRALGNALPWPTLMLGVAGLAAAGGLLLFLGTTDAPGAQARVTTLQWRALATVWTDARVRSSVLAYFGHMWELYTMWVMVPLVLATRVQGLALSWAAFAVLGAGAIGCALGGWVAQRWGSARVAAVQLATSGLCCLAAAVGRHRGRRLSPALHSDRTQRPGPGRGQRVDAHQQHRVCHFDCQHSAVRIAGGDRGPGRAAAVAGAGPGTGPAGAAPAAA